MMHKETLLAIDARQFDLENRELRNSTTTIETWSELQLPKGHRPDWTGIICCVARMQPEQGRKVLAAMYYGLHGALAEA